MTPPTAPPSYLDRHPLILFGGYALVVIIIFALASSGSGLAMVGVALLLAAVIGGVLRWSRAPLPFAAVVTSEATAGVPQPDEGVEQRSDEG